MNGQSLTLTPIVLFYLLVLLASIMTATKAIEPACSASGTPGWNNLAIRGLTYVNDGASTSQDCCSTCVANMECLAWTITIDKNQTLCCLALLQILKLLVTVITL